MVALVWIAGISVMAMALIGAFGGGWLAMAVFTLLGKADRAVGPAATATARDEWHRVIRKMRSWSLLFGFIYGVFEAAKITGFVSGAVRPLDVFFSVKVVVLATAGAFALAFSIARYLYR